MAADVGEAEKLVMNPAEGRVGTRFDLVCRDFPEPSLNDAVYIVTAGTPDVDPNSNVGRQEKILWSDLAVTCFRNDGHFYSKAGPFAPGNYEVRFVTSLYNNDKCMEIATRTAFSLR